MASGLHSMTERELPRRALPLAGLRTLAFASIFISPYHVTPWLLLREERLDTA